MVAQVLEIMTTNWKSIPDTSEIMRNKIANATDTVSTNVTNTIPTSMTNSISVFNATGIMSSNFADQKNNI